jgi:hypothetical protein
MKLKTLSFATLKPGHTYISKDLNHIYKVAKTYGNKNSVVDVFELTWDSSSLFPKYSVYTYIEEHKVSVSNPKIEVYDLGIKPIYYRKDYNTLIHTKIDKVISDFNRFIHSIN